MPRKKGTRQQPAAANNLEEYKKSIKSIAEDQSKDTQAKIDALLDRFAKKAKTSGTDPIWQNAEAIIQKIQTKLTDVDKRAPNRHSIANLQQKIDCIARTKSQGINYARHQNTGNLEVNKGLSESKKFLCATLNEVQNVFKTEKEKLEQEQVKKAQEKIKLESTATPTEANDEITPENKDELINKLIKQLRQKDSNQYSFVNEVVDQLDTVKSKRRGGRWNAIYLFYKETEDKAEFKLNETNEGLEDWDKFLLEDGQKNRMYEIATRQKERILQKVLKDFCKQKQEEIKKAESIKKLEEIIKEIDRRC